MLRNSLFYTLNVKQWIPSEAHRLILVWKRDPIKIHCNTRQKTYFCLRNCLCPYLICSLSKTILLILAYVKMAMHDLPWFLSKIMTLSCARTQKCNKLVFLASSSDMAPKRKGRWKKDKKTVFVMIHQIPKETWHAEEDRVPWWYRLFPHS